MIKEQMQRSRWTPWIGLVAPPVAWAIHRQVGADLVFYDCRIGQVGLVIVLGVTMGAISAVSGLISWSSRKDSPGMELRTVAASIGAMSGAIVCLALAIQTLATLLLPACAR